jgi:hypothetical protein
MRALVHRPGCPAPAATTGALAFAALAVLAALAALGRPAAAQQVMMQADGTVNVGYTQTTSTPIQSDPNADAEDVLPASVGSAFTEIRPGITLQSGSPRLAWRAGYLFSGALSFEGDSAVAYSNQASAGLVALISQYTTMSVNASIAQGGTSFLLSQVPAEAGRPEIRAPGNPKMVTATISETMSRELGRQLSMSQNFTANLSAPQDDLGARNSSLSDSVAIDFQSGRNSLGAELRGTFSNLRPLREDLEPYSSVAATLLGRWNRDFTANWNGFAMAGVEQIYTGAGSQPLAFLPTGSLVGRYARGNMVGALEVSHGSATNLQVGTVSLTDRITARGVITLDVVKSRILSFSAGALHNEPLGEVDALVAAGTGNAMQLDAGFSTMLVKNVFANARYSLAYQFGQAGGLSPTLTHVFMLGVTASYNNLSDEKKRMPRRGLRVDGSDGDGFPVVPEP